MTKDEHRHKLAYNRAEHMLVVNIKALLHTLNDIVGREKYRMVCTDYYKVEPHQ